MKHNSQTLYRMFIKSKKIILKKNIKQIPPIQDKKNRWDAIEI